METLTLNLETFFEVTKPLKVELFARENLLHEIQTCVLALESQTRASTFINYESQSSPYTLSQHNNAWKVLKSSLTSWSIDHNEFDDDLVIIVDFKPTKKDRIYLLNELSKIISENESLKVVNIFNIKRPIIQVLADFYFKTHHNSIILNISIVDNVYEKTMNFMNNTLESYEEKEIPIRKLIIFIKYWCKQHGINDALKGYLNPLGYSLMVIKFLDIYQPMSIENIFNDFSFSQKQSKNSLASLIIHFFTIYSTKWNPAIHSIAIGNSNKRKLNKFNKKRDKFCCMEILDPIKRDNIAIDIGFKQLKYIKKLFKTSYYICSKIKMDQNIFNLLTVPVLFRNIESLFGRGYHEINYLDSNDIKTMSKPFVFELDVSKWKLQISDNNNYDHDDHKCNNRKNDEIALKNDDEKINANQQQNVFSNAGGGIDWNWESDVATNNAISAYFGFSWSMVDDVNDDHKCNKSNNDNNSVLIECKKDNKDQDITDDDDDEDEDDDIDINNKISIETNKKKKKGHVGLKENGNRYKQKFGGSHINDNNTVNNMDNNDNNKCNNNINDEKTNRNNDDNQDNQEQQEKNDKVTNVFSNFGKKGGGTGWNWESHSDGNNTTNNIRFASVSITNNSNQPLWINQNVVDDDGGNNNSTTDPFAPFVDGGFGSLLN